MKDVKKHIQNWKDIRIADISKLYAIAGDGLKDNLNKGKKRY